MAASPWRNFRYALFLWLLPAILGILSPADAQDGRTLSQTAYWELVAETEAEVTRVADADAATTKAALAPLAGRWAAVEQVRLPDGNLLPVDNERLVMMLAAEDPEPARIGDYLAALQLARRGWPETIYDMEDAARLRAPLDEILARAEFQWQAEEPSLLQRIWQRIARALFDLLPAGQGSQFLNYLFTALGALALLAILAYAARSLFGSLTSEAEGERSAHPEGELTAEEALARADALARGGDHRAAVRYLYLSTLLLLDERGILRYDRSRTNREYLRSVADRSDVARTLQSVVEVFDRTWYGYQPLDAESYAAYEAAVNSLKRVKEKQ